MSMVTPLSCFWFISFPLLGGLYCFHGNLFAELAHVVADSRHRHALEQEVPVNPLEGELAQIVHVRFAQQREWPDERQRIFSGNWLQVIIKIEQERLVVSGFDEAIRMAIELRVERLAFDVMNDVLGQHFRFKMRNRTSL